MRRFLTDKGEYYLIHAPDGELTEEAVAVLRTAARTGADLLYADELVRGGDGKLRPLKKPGPSPDTLLSYNCLGSPLAVSEALLRKVGPPASDSYAERWAFSMRAFFAASFVLHIPRALYIGALSEHETDCTPVSMMLKRLQRGGEAHPARARGCVSVRYFCPPETLLTAVVAAEELGALRSTLESIELFNTETRIEYLVIDGGAPSERKEAYYRALENCGLRLMRRWYEPNLARLFNMAAEEARGEAMIFLRAGDRIGSQDALRYMLEFAMQPHVGAVCGWPERPEAAKAYVCNVKRIAGPLMLARDKLWLAGGFDESLPESGTETALSITLRERRRHLVRTPDAVLPMRRRREPEDERNRIRRKDYSI